MIEELLTGGRLTPGVVRAGDTVRRPGSDRSAFTAQLLELLAENGFVAAPTYLGQDETGRDVLTYLDGWVPSRYQRWEDAAWTWCIASKHADPERHAHQVRVLADAYALQDTAGLIPAVLAQQLHNVDFWTRRPGKEQAERIAWSYREHAFVSTNRHIFEDALTGGRPF